MLILAPVPGPGSGTGLPGPILAAWSKLNRTPLYDVLLFTYVIFGANVFYMLAITSVFVLRRRHPEWDRPYRSSGRYPVTPTLYVIAALVLLGNMLHETPTESLAGLSIIALGLPAYWVFHRGYGAAESA